MSTRGAENRGKRTNSLAFAAVDCHTCSTRGTKCDRRRPQCLSCLGKGIKCAGFVTPLSWDQRRIWVADGNHHIESSGPSANPVNRIPSARARKFRFVGANARKELNSTAQRMTQGRGNPPTASQAAGSDTTTTNPDALAWSEADHDASQHARIEEVSTSEADQVMSQELPPIINPPSTASYNGSSSTGTEGLHQDQNPHDYPASNFTTAAIDQTLPFMGLTMPMSFGQIGLSTGGDFLDLDSMDVGDNDNVFQQSSLLDISQQNIWSPLPDFPQTPSPLKLPSSIPRQPDPLAWTSDPENYEIFLNIYDSELCVLPITSDTIINPFRCQKETSRGSRLLFHSIIALCYQHLHFQTESWLEEVQEHKTQANNEMSMALTSIKNTKSDLSLLDAILVMFTLDCTLSAAGSWTTHLRRARTVIDACGGPTSLNSARARSQAGMLLWWDAALALVSRKELVFDSSYVDFLLEYEENDPWSFYDLTGCPAEIIRYMVDLAELAQEFELASKMKWVSFDLTPVLAVEERLIAWKSDKRPRSFASPRSATSPRGNSALSPENVVASSEDEYEEEINSAEDQRHCIEAWRRALLIYVRRVFKLDQQNIDTVGRRPECSIRVRQPQTPQWSQLWNGSSLSNGGDKATSSPLPHDADARPRRMPFFSLVRATINDIRCVRRSSQIQKQLLLPAFIAGSETSDSELRRFICAYCDWWSNKSRYKMFDTMRKLLLQIWEEMDKPESSTGAFQSRPSSGTQWNFGVGVSQSQSAEKNPIRARNPPWWGSVVDKNAQTIGPEGFPVEYLFG